PPALPPVPLHLPLHPPAPPPLLPPPHLPPPHPPPPHWHLPRRRPLVGDCNSPQIRHMPHNNHYEYWHDTSPHYSSTFANQPDTSPHHRHHNRNRHWSGRRRIKRKILPKRPFPTRSIRECLDRTNLHCRSVHRGIGRI
ncbi:hypothetical protein ACHAXH_001058, partial [Discostella pseudostelligera]